MGNTASTAAIPADPVAGIGIAEFGARLRRREITVESVTGDYLARIERLDRRLGAFELVTAEAALRTARAIDGLLASGVDLGPLMGVPIAIKDLFAVEGTPTTAGSRVDVADLTGAEGPFVRTLKRAGCVILGKTRTVEFALGAAGINTVRGTPWNPCDAATHRVPGGSSSGSAVAVAAGLCAFAIGSDTGGSIRIPAALCGIFGLKTTAGLWPTEGVFPLSTTLDTIGLLARSAADAALAFAALCGRRPVEPAPLAGLSLGRPVKYLGEDLDPAIAACLDAALERLRQGGAAIVEIEVPEAREREAFFPTVLPSELIASLGRERFERGRERMDAVVAARAARGLEVKATDYIRCLRRHEELKRIGVERMRGLDAWVGPSVALLPVPVGEFKEVERGLQLTAALTRQSQPVNMFGQCGTSSPIHHLGAALPVGLQIVCNPLAEDVALSIALAVERALGLPPAPDLSRFV